MPSRRSVPGGDATGTSPGLRRGLAAQERRPARPQPFRVDTFDSPFRPGVDQRRLTFTKLSVTRPGEERALSTTIWYPADPVAAPLPGRPNGTGNAAFALGLTHAPLLIFSNECIRPVDPCDDPTTLTQEEAHRVSLRYAVPFFLHWVAGDHRLRAYLAPAPGVIFTVDPAAPPRARPEVALHLGPARLPSVSRARVLSRVSCRDAFLRVVLRRAPPAPFEDCRIELTADVDPEDPFAARLTALVRNALESESAVMDPQNHILFDRDDVLAAARRAATRPPSPSRQASTRRRHKRPPAQLSAGSCPWCKPTSP